MVIRAEERRKWSAFCRLIGIPPRSILIEVLIEVADRGGRRHFGNRDSPGPAR